MIQMVNFYEHLRDSLHFNKFALDNLLCVEYSCPLKEEEVGIWAQTDQIVHVLSGKKSWRMHQGIFEVNEGHTVYIKKGAAFIKQFFDDDFCMLAFFMTDDLIRDALKDVRADLLSESRAEADFQLLYIEDNNLLRPYFQGVLHHFQNKAQPMETLLELKFKELIISIITGNQNPQLTSYLLDIAKTSRPSLPYIMEQNYCYNLTLPEFAKLCHRSLSSFKRDFQEHFQTTPGKWLTSKRLERAAILLKDDTLNIAEVAYECGFKDHSHFGRSFRGKFGKTPLAFRNSIKLA